MTTHNAGEPSVEPTVAGPQSEAAVAPSEVYAAAMPTVLSEEQRRLLAAVLDQIVPPHDGLPGAGGLGVLGPADVSPNDLAAIMTEVLGRPIRFQAVSGAAHKQTLLSVGSSEAMAQSLVDMHAAIDEGLYNAEPRTRENTTPTSFRQWSEEFLKPALSG